jgi:hypothetical protein
MTGGREIAQCEPVSAKSYLRIKDMHKKIRLYEARIGRVKGRLS